MRKIIKIDQSLIDQTTNEAKSAIRLRKNFNFHERYDDPINRMLNAMEPGTYVRPHKHENPDKTEVFLILRGRIVVVCFDEYGVITDHFLLDPKEGNYGVEIPPNIWHSVISLEEGSIVYEIKDGPYLPINDKDFAPWAPEEGSGECVPYMQQILKQLNIK